MITETMTVRLGRWLRWRQVLDRMLAAVGLLVVSPIIVGLANLIRKRDGARGIVCLPRVGQYGHPLEMLKLRTMKASTSNGRASGPPITSSSDDRITPMGRWLRPYRIDELPQLWNVIRGDMALIGPRPEAPEYVDIADETWASVLRAKPGIIGPTQIVVCDWEGYAIANGDEGLYRNQILPVKLAIDSWYVQHATARLDLLVVVSLVQRFLACRKRTVLHNEVRRNVPLAVRIRTPVQDRRWQIRGAKAIAHSDGRIGVPERGDDATDACSIGSWTRAPHMPATDVVQRPDGDNGHGRSLDRHPPRFSFRERYHRLGALWNPGCLDTMSGR